MKDGRAWNVEVHDPHIGRGSLLSEHRNLLAEEAIAFMESNSDKAFCLRQRGEAHPSDHPKRLPGANRETARANVLGADQALRFDPICP
jgi:hypothetical protein